MISTKLFWFVHLLFLVPSFPNTQVNRGTQKGVNAKGLSHKHIVEGLNASLARLQLDYVDLLFCHSMLLFESSLRRHVLNIRVS